MQFKKKKKPKHFSAFKIIVTLHPVNKTHSLSRCGNSIIIWGIMLNHNYVKYFHVDK